MILTKLAIKNELNDTYSIVQEGHKIKPKYHNVDYSRIFESDMQAISRDKTMKWGKIYYLIDWVVSMTNILSIFTCLMKANHCALGPSFKIK